jgi:hypothetical protein
MASVTVLIVPRDRYTGVLECIDALYEHTDQAFKLIVADLEYPAALIEKVRARLAGVADAEVVSMGLITPMQALARLRDRLDSDVTVWVDNDSQVTAGWLPPLVETIEGGAAIASPLILEKEGVDAGAPLRNHLYTSEIRVVQVDGRDYLIEDKKYRREVPERLPREQAEIETFELHGVAFRTSMLKEIEIPDMVVREHIDICMQLKARGERVVVEPRSVVLFDNLGTRMSRSDMRFFFFRWSRELAEKSHRNFEARWGYPFYSEQSMYNWAFRRKAFLLARWAGMPIPVANKMTGVAKRLFCQDWDPLKDPTGASKHLYSVLPEHRPLLRSSVGAL